MYRPKSSTRMPSSTFVIAGGSVPYGTFRLDFDRSTFPRAAEDSTQDTTEDLPSELAADRARRLLGERLGHALPALRPPDDLAESATAALGARLRSCAARTCHGRRGGGLARPR